MTTTLRRGALAAAFLCALAASPACAGRLRIVPRPPMLTSILSGGPILPNGALVRDGERLRTLELEELAPVCLRFTIRF